MVASSNLAKPTIYYFHPQHPQDNSMNNKTTDFFEIIFALAALAIMVPLVGAGIYATILSIL
tara:strand:+ start:1052 stop:1237 length:186 start_codon:yes stop_codon:yes gene_type:complete